MTLRFTPWLKSWFKSKLLLWLDKRQPATSVLTLQQHLLFVFPTSYGGWFVMLIALLYLFGTNYQNNLILLCAYLLLSLFCCCILAAFFNLYRLKLSSTPAQFYYAGDAIQLRLKLEHYQHKKMIRLFSDDFHPLFLESLSEELVLDLYPKRRGYYQLQRFTLLSCYPFGLIRCWTHIQLLQSYWVYPEARPLNKSQPVSTEHLPDQPDQLAPYQAGSPASALDWKRLAKTPWQPVIRQHSSHNSIQQPKHLTVNTSGTALEQQLAEFCAQIHEFERKGYQYSLNTPGEKIPVGHGQPHLHRCLQALALC